MNLVFCTYNRIEVFDTLRNLISFKTHSCFKIVIIDNYGFPKLKSFCEDNNMSYFLQKKLGLSVARNTALDLLPNEWVYFFDDDVFFTQEILECLNNVRDQNKIIYSAVYPSCPPIIDGELITGSQMVNVFVWCKENWSQKYQSSVTPEVIFGNKFVEKYLIQYKEWETMSKVTPNRRNVAII